MIDLKGGGVFEAAAWRVRNLEDFEARLEAAARRVDELDRERESAGLLILESVLTRSGRPPDETRALVRRFEETFSDEEDELTIPRISGILNVEGDSWFFGDASLRTMAGQLLGQFQHRVTQYNYVSEREVLRRWANSHDTRLFIRRRIHETEPIVGVVDGTDLALMQTLRVASGGNTVVPTPSVARVLVALGVLDEEHSSDDYAVLAAAEGLALRLDFPAPIVGEMLERLSSEDRLEFPKPPAAEEPDQIDAEDEPRDADVPEPEGAKPGPEDKEARRGEEPKRVQDPQARDAPGVREEAGSKPEPAPPRTGRDDGSAEDAR